MTSSISAACRETISVLILDKSYLNPPKHKSAIFQQSLMEQALKPVEEKQESMFVSNDAGEAG